MSPSLRFAPECGGKVQGRVKGRDETPSIEAGRHDGPTGEGSEEPYREGSPGHSLLRTLRVIPFVTPKSSLYRPKDYFYDEGEPKPHPKPHRTPNLLHRNVPRTSHPRRPPAPASRERTVHNSDVVKVALRMVGSTLRTETGQDGSRLGTSTLLHLARLRPDDPPSGPGQMVTSQRHGHFLRLRRLHCTRLKGPLGLTTDREFPSCGQTSLCQDDSLGSPSDLCRPTPTDPHERGPGGGGVTR